LYGFYLTDMDAGYNHKDDNLKETKACIFQFDMNIYMQL
jgi:hypothetical protein